MSTPDSTRELQTPLQRRLEQDAEISMLEQLLDQPPYAPWETDPAKVFPLPPRPLNLPPAYKENPLS